MRKAIILGAGFVSLGVIRALASEGVQVIYLSTADYDFARFSRFISTSLKVPSPKKEGAKLLDLLMTAKPSWSGALLVPADDHCVMFISQNRDKLTKRYATAVEEWDVIKRIINKNNLYLQAQQLGVPAPKVYFPDSVAYLREKKDELQYPCIIKPFRTLRFYAIYNKKVLIIESYEELIEKYLDIKNHDLDVMVSEIIPGPVTRLFHYRSYIDRQGKVLAEMCTQKLRQHPPNFGMASAAKTVPIIPELREQTLTLLKNCDYHGVSSAEFKFDTRDNSYKLIEINVRPVLPESHFVASGINFAHITYQDLVEYKKISKPVYDTDTYWIHNYFDILDFIKHARSANFSFREYVKPYLQKKKVFGMPFFDDPVPFFMTSAKIWTGIKTLFTNIKGRLTLKLLHKEMK